MIHNDHEIESRKPYNNETPARYEIRELASAESAETTEPLLEKSTRSIVSARHFVISVALVYQ